MSERERTNHYIYHVCKNEKRFTMEPNFEFAELNKVSNNDEMRKHD